MLNDYAKFQNMKLSILQKFKIKHKHILPAIWSFIIIIIIAILSKKLVNKNPNIFNHICTFLLNLYIVKIINKFFDA